MGLALQPTRRLGGKIATLIAVFALVVQPMYGLVASHVVSAVEATSPSVKMTHFSTYSEELPSKGIYFQFDFTGFDDANRVEVYIERKSGGRVIKQLKPSSVAEYVNGKSRLSGRIFTKEMPGQTEDSSSSWDRVRHIGDASSNVTWTTETVPTSAYVAIYSNNRAPVVSEAINFVETHNGRTVSYLDIVPDSPSITSVRYATTTSPKTTYSGIVVDFQINNFVDAYDCSITIHRADGTDASRTCGPDLLAHFNSTSVGGKPKSTTTPFNLLGSAPGGWYANTTGTWDQSTLPVGVTISIDTHSHGLVKAVLTDALDEGYVPYSDIAPLDATAPNVQIASSPRFMNPTTFKFDLTATDAKSGVGKWALIFLDETGKDMRIGRVPCSPQTTGNNATATCYVDADFSKFESGKQYTARAIATDREGNAGIAERQFIADMTAPEPRFIDAPSVLNPTTFKFNLTATDAKSGVGRWGLIFLDEAGKDMRIGRVPCSPQTTGNNATATCYVDADFSKFESGKQYTARAVVTDRAGNVANYVEHVFTADSAGPRVTHFELESLKAGKFNPTKVIARATDDDSFVTSVKIDTYKMREDGTWQYTYSPFVQGSETSGVERNFAEFSSGNARIKEDGTYMLKAWAVDVAGNIGAPTESQVFIVDNTAPTATISSDIDNKVVKSAAGVQVNLTSNDTVGLMRYDLTLWKDGTRVPKASPILSRGGKIPADQVNAFNHSFNLPNDLNLADGNYTIYYTVKDLAGNSTNATSVKFTIDTTGPAISITDVDAESNTFSGTVTGDDSRDYIRLSLYELDEDGNAVRDGEGNQVAVITKEVPLVNGEWSLALTEAESDLLKDGVNYRVVARSYDTLGNSATDVSRFTFTANGENEATGPEDDVETGDSKEDESGSTEGAGGGSDTDTNGDGVVEVTDLGNTSPAPATATLANIFTGQPSFPISADTVVANDTDADDSDVAAATNSRDNGENGDVLAAEDARSSWSLANLLLTIVIAALGVVALAGLAGKKGRTSVRIATIIPAIGAGAVLLFVENFSAPMGLVNIWTLLVGGLLIAQMVLLANTRPSQAE